METSFTEIEAQQTETPTPFNPIADSGVSETNNQGATAEANNQVATTSGGQLSTGLDLSATGIQGEVRRQDINIPKLALVNALSKARTDLDAPLGGFMFADEVLLCKPEKGQKISPEIEVFVLNAIKGYQKDVPFGSDEPLVRAATAQEVRELGGTLDRRDKSKPLFVETAQILFLVPRPEDCEEAHESYFRFEFGGKFFAKALFYVKSFSYTNVFKPIVTRVNNTGEPVINTSFKLWSQFMETDTFRWWTPKLKTGRLTTPEERAYLASKQQ